MVLISTFTAPVEGLKHQQPFVRVVFNDKDVGKGTLYIHEHVLAWRNDTEPLVGFSIEYPHISLHALSKDPASFPHPCIYVMLDGRAHMPGEDEIEPENNENDDSDEDSVPDITEIRLIPDDENSLEIIFNAIQVCQALNPDPNDSMSDDDEYFDGEYHVGEGDNFEEDDDDIEPNNRLMNALNLNGRGSGDGPDYSNNEAFEDAD